MIATVNSQVLAAELRLLSKVVPVKPAIAVLSHAMMTAKDGNLHFHATDLEVGLSTSCAARVEAEGSITLPAERLLALVEQFPDADVDILADTHVTIKCGAFKSKLQMMPVEEFPPLPKVEGTSSTIDADVLRQLIGRVRYAVQASGPKYALQGALTIFKGSSAAMVATDSKRLALATAGKEANGDQHVIVPTKALDVLAKQANQGDVELTVGPNHLFFSLGGRLLTSRIIDSQFPKYEKIIPQDNDKVVTVNRAALTVALKRVEVISEVSRAVKFSLSPGSLELSAASSGLGSADEAMRVEYDGPPLEGCINGDYVLDFLESAEGEMISVALKDASTPALFTSSGGKHVAVVMLMRMA